MVYMDLRKALKEKRPSGGYFLYGSDDYLKRAALAELRKAALKDCPDGLEDFNRSVFSPQDDDFSGIESAILSPPVMAESRIVEFVPPSFASLMKGRRVKDEADAGGEGEAEGGGTAAGLKKFLSVLESLADAPETVLAVVSWGDDFDAGTAKKPSSALKQLTKYLTPVECSEQTGARLKTWVEHHLGADGLTIGPQGYDAVVAHCPKDMLTLANELDKVACYVLAQGRTEVTAEDVLLVTSPMREEEDFALQDAILSGDRRGALAVVDLRRKRRDYPGITLASLNPVLCNLLTVSKLLDEGKSEAEIASVTKLHPFVVQKYARAAHEFTTPRIAATLRRLREADVSSKTESLSAHAGNHMDYIPLERFLCTIPIGSRFKRK